MPTDDLDRLWDFSNPTLSRERFRTHQAETTPLGPVDQAILLTQLARTHSLERQFDQATSLLNQAEHLLSSITSPTPTPHHFLAQALIAIERGRVLNSNNQPAAALPHFHESLRLAQLAGDEPLIIDALHMIAIAAPTPPEQIAWTERALTQASAATHPRALRWRASLLNNLAWSHHNAGHYPQALALFEAAVTEREKASKPHLLHIAQWSVARALRSLGRHEEALTKLQALAKTPNYHSEGFLEEELAENLAALNRPEEARPYFAAAYEKLSKLDWLKAQSPERLESLRERSR